MDYGEIAGNSSIDAMIYKSFEALEERDRRRFVKKFREQRKDEHQVMHTFRELLLGAFLGSHDFLPEYEPTIDGKTPDWRFVREGQVTIVDVVNLHPNKQTDDEQQRALAKSSSWTGWLPSESPRIHSSLSGKAECYSQLLERLQCPYVVGMYPWFFAAISIAEVVECVNQPDGVFPQYPRLSGILFFEERGRIGSTDNPMVYQFTYLANPAATIPIEIPSGTVPILLGNTAP
jgi:hypothetical protein